MIRARIVTPWVAVDAGDETEYWPRLIRDYPQTAEEELHDVTDNLDAVIPEPNAYSVEVLMHEATFAQVEADPTYVILWSEEA